MVKIFATAAIALLLLSAGCSVPPQKPVADSAADSAAEGWRALRGWQNDDHAQALGVFLNSCAELHRTPQQYRQWEKPCAAAAMLPEDASAEDARLFFETHFYPKTLRNEAGDTGGLITGYYEPLLHGDLRPSARYRYPIYGRPDDLLSVELGEVYPALRARRVRGRLHGDKVVPYYSRAEIDGPAVSLGGELFWVEDKIALFFLHVQGSGIVQLPDGRLQGVGYRDQNGHAYRSIGKWLADHGEIPLADVNLFSIRRWLRENPSRLDEVLNHNPSYVFFTHRPVSPLGPVGAGGVALTPERSLAVDTDHIALGSPVWLDTVMPDDATRPLRRLMIAQDTGGAIRGAVRADVFWGRGARAEKMAGLMKTRGRLTVLVPRE